MSMCCRFECNKQLMDEYSGKRGIDGVVVPRKGMGVEFRDTANTRDRNGQICSRLGCSSKANPPKVAQVGSSEKGKSLRPSMRSSGKEVIGSSSRATSSPGKPLTEPQKTLISQFETDSSETSSVQDEPEISELDPPPVRYPRGFQDEGERTDFRDVIRMDTRSQRNFHQRPGWRQQEIKSTGPVTNAVSSRYGLRNLRCNSISDVIPAACSSSDSPFNRRKGVMKKRHSEEGSSSTVRGKKMTESSLEGSNSGSRNGISISDSRRSRIIPSHRDSSIASVRTQRSVSSYARGRFSSQGNENPAGETNESPLTLQPLSPHSGDVNAPGSPYHTSVETPFSRPSSYSRPGASSEQLCGVMPMSPAEYGITRSLINQDSFWRYDMDGIAEVIFYLNMGGHIYYYGF